MRLPVVGVMGSGGEAHERRATEVGRWLAEQEVHLLTGGGGGVMAAVSRAYCESPGRRGLAIGVLPGDPDDRGVAPRAGYPNPWVELAIRTHLPLSGTRGREAMSRNHINVLSSDAVIALPGGAGTASEVSLALDYGVPVVAYLGDRSQIEGLPPAAPVESDLDRVAAFVLRALDARRR